MTVVLSVLLALIAVGAVFVVWLAVRIVNRKERWAKRVALGLCVLPLILYPFSIGPVAWLSQNQIAFRHHQVIQATEIIYAPVLWIRDNGPTLVHDAIWWYIGLWANTNPY